MTNFWIPWLVGLLVGYIVGRVDVDRANLETRAELRRLRLTYWDYVRRHPMIVVPRGGDNASTSQDAPITGQE